MYISKIKIKNFKCFNDVEVEFDPNFNLIIGQNNSGKSTIFDALRLWQLAFQKFLKDRTNNKQSSFYVCQYFSFTIDDISFLRIQDFKNLYKNPY
ncbi:MAG: AAA family ATPase, partial [Capnocytophaga sp.]